MVLVKLDWILNEVHCFFRGTLLFSCQKEPLYLKVISCENKAGWHLLNMCTVLIQWNHAGWQRQTRARTSIKSWCSCVCKQAQIETWNRKILWDCLQAVPPPNLSSSNISACVHCFWDANFSFVCAQRSISLSEIFGVDRKSWVDATQWLEYYKWCKWCNDKPWNERTDCHTSGYRW